MSTRKPIPVIDLFAGPGGLGEGFSATMGADRQPPFRLALSIEMDAVAHRTLTLRGVFRRLKAIGKADLFYRYVQGRIKKEEFWDHPVVLKAQAEVAKEAKRAELGVTSKTEIDGWIKHALGGSKEWVLIGGPPCQAYSLVGRARRRHDTEFSKDKKHFLYREYLRIIKEFRPSIFVMENVKGLLSSKNEGASLFALILRDLREPASDLRYDIRSFVSDERSSNLEPRDFIIRAEDYGVPQERHRVILLGVRSDFAHREHVVLQRKPKATVRQTIGNLPRLRSGVSKRNTESKTAVNTTEWTAILSGAIEHLSGWRDKNNAATKTQMRRALDSGPAPESIGSAFVSATTMAPPLASQLAKWLLDPKLAGIIQHIARSHMTADLHRYLFLASFAKVAGYSPTLDQLPVGLLPRHRNASKPDAPFKDRFKVQLADHPSSTVTSHISKDGHYYIHYDPRQCRSLTPREAARLQTFPDNYFFEGPRTEQFKQIGNAVPPYLAAQLASVVAKLLGR